MSRRVGVVSLSDPYKARHGGTLRTRGLINLLEDRDYDVELLIPSKALGNSFSTQLAPGAAAGVRSTVGRLKRHYLPMPTSIGARDSDLADTIRREHFDLLLVSAISQAQFSELSQAPLWLDFMDVWSAVVEREAMTRRGLARHSSRLQGQLLRRLEARYAPRAAIVTAAGWEDWRRLADRGVSATWLPTSLPDDEFLFVPHNGAHGATVGFLGNFAYWPNRDAYALLTTYWAEPLARAGWRVIVAGRHSDSLASPPKNVEIIGELENVDDFYSEVRATLAPIRLGGGIKVKVIESLAKGVPVVGTQFAFEGFPPDLRKYFARVDEHDFTPSSLESLERFEPSTSDLDPFRASFSSRMAARLLEAL